jgi:hypothetical protein
MTTLGEGTAAAASDCFCKLGLIYNASTSACATNDTHHRNKLSAMFCWFKYSGASSINFVMTLAPSTRMMKPILSKWSTDPHGAMAFRTAVLNVLSSSLFAISR